MNLRLCQAHANTFTAHVDALFLQCRLLFRGDLIAQLAEDQLQIRQVLVIDLHVA
ncbi:hypothetical protein D3C80_1792780 [compost metagenome]